MIYRKEMAMYPYQSNIRLGAVSLNVSDLEVEVQYYQKVLGLDVLDRESTSVTLGVLSTQDALVRLVQVDSELSKSYGLYHLALLLPSRSDLGDFLNHLIKHQIAIIGGANHGYSEAIYLEDTEGNGIEVYHDKSESVWDKQGDKINSITEELDVAGILESAHQQNQDSAFRFPQKGKMGHIHLSVASVPEATSFYQNVFDMTEKFSVPAASWISSGGYHHHFAFNSWAGSKLVSHAQDEVLGLLDFTVYVANPVHMAQIKTKAESLGQLRATTDTGLVIEDPSQNRIVVQLES